MEWLKLAGLGFAVITRTFKGEIYSSLAPNPSSMAFIRRPYST